MTDTDKYPSETGRRRFVKGVVGAGVLAGTGTGAGAALTTATSSTGAGGGITQYRGIENTDGPAPRGMPMVPIEIDNEGFLKGVWPKVGEREEGGRTITVAEMQLGGVHYSSTWFQYCGVQTYQGVQPEYESDNYLRASTGTYSWQDEIYSDGDKINVADFQDYDTWTNGIGRPGIGKPAITTWRSQDADNTMPVQVLRSTRVEEMAQESDWMNAATSQGFMAWLDKCTHFCCVPNFKSPGSAKFNAENAVYCQCHQSVYDPFSIVDKSFVALPRPEE